MAQSLTAFKSPLHQMTQTTPTCLWNDSASIQELTYSIEHGGVGATCNPVIVVEVLKKEMPLWKDRIQQLIRESRQTAAEFRELARVLRQDPSSLIYEPPASGVEITR